MKKEILLLLLFLLLFSYLVSESVSDSAPAQATVLLIDKGVSFEVKDRKWDDGSALDLSWSLASDSSSVSVEDQYDWIKIYRLDAEKPPQLVHESSELIGEIIDKDLSFDQKYSYQLVAFKGFTRAESDSIVVTAFAVPTQQWFYMSKLSLLLLLVIISAAILLYIYSARRGKELFIRRINGLDSMEEGIGRATEKGKPILFVPGIGELDDIQTIGSLTILSHLAFRAAEYNTDLIVPCRSSMVLSAAREVVKEAFLRAGKPDSYKENSVFYLTDDQFGYVAGIDGIMVREQPAANFFLGTFFAESLILAETGFSTGAIQTSGTANAHQLPFFIVSCDYTLIGEELFAASAYLSKDPQQLGSLKGHDFGKILFILMILVGVALEIIGYSQFRNFFTIG